MARDRTAGARRGIRLPCQRGVECGSRIWSAEIGVMWRFTRNNGITEGFRNFQN